MKLSEVLKQATPYPWATSCVCKFRIIASVCHEMAGATGGTVADVYTPYTAPNAPKDYTVSEANAALICHAVNNLPKLVEALKSISNEANFAELSNSQTLGEALIEIERIARQALSDAEEVKGIYHDPHPTPIPRRGQALDCNQRPT